MDPFTGCFMSLLPVTLACLRLALKAASFFNKNQNKEAWQLLELGTSRLHKLIKEHPEVSISLKEQYLEEKKSLGCLLQYPGQNGKSPG